MNAFNEPEIFTDWNDLLSNEFRKDYFKNIISFLDNQSNQGACIYPPQKLIFEAFNKVALNKIKVVILGQDPYHKPRQAQGLSFSVPKTEKVPPSLRNVYKELSDDIHDFENPGHGNLEQWANQGVLLLNAFLTVEHKKPGSHQNIGWEVFTNAVISGISERRNDVVFMLWGNFAKKKSALIDDSKHLILQAAHPSPLARNAFFGNKHFSKANEFLLSKNYLPIDWKLTPVSIQPSLFNI
jgi:uracil-DNA glycosylase